MLKKFPITTKQLDLMTQAHNAKTQADNNYELIISSIAAGHDLGDKPATLHKFGRNEGLCYIEYNLPEEGKKDGEAKTPEGESKSNDAAPSKDSGK